MGLSVRRAIYHPVVVPDPNLQVIWQLFVFYIINRHVVGVFDVEKSRCVSVGVSGVNWVNFHHKISQVVPDRDLINMLNGIQGIRQLILVRNKSDSRILKPYPIRATPNTYLCNFVG